MRTDGEERPGISSKDFSSNRSIVSIFAFLYLINMSADQQPLDQPIHQAITDLAQELEQKPWILASGGDESVAEKSLSAAKAIFDLGTFIYILIWY